MSINLVIFKSFKDLFPVKMADKESCEKDPEKFSGDEDSSDDSNDGFLSEQMIRQMLKMRLNAGQVPQKKKVFFLLT